MEPFFNFAIEKFTIEKTCSIFTKTIPSTL